MAVLTNNNPTDTEGTDLGTLWQEALNKYYEESGTDLRNLPVSQLDMNHIRAEQEHQLSLFSNYRHDKGKLDKLRTLVSKNSSIVTSVATHIANAASTAFPPSAAILTAFNYVMNASRAVSDDYDLIVSFFDIMNSFLERVSMLESRMPDEWQFRHFLVNVFSAIMTLSAIARKCRLGGRLKKWAKALIDGSDPKLKGAFDSLHTQLERFESAAMLATLKHTLDSERKIDSLGQDINEIQAGVKKTHADVEKNLAISRQNYMIGLESRGYSKDAASTGHEILAVVTRQEQQGAEYASGMYQVMKTINKMSNANGRQDQKLVDAGSRQSIAMHTLETLLYYDLDDTVDLAGFEGHYIDGTYSWFLEQDVYKNLEAGKARLVWVSGPAGMGKSTLAYTITKTLQEELAHDTATAVAHFFFNRDGDRSSVSQMLRSCALQVASRNSGYREEAIADVQIYDKHHPEFRYIGQGINEDEEEMWKVLYETKFTKKSERRLVLVLDGMEEIDEEDRGIMRKLLENISRSEDLNVQVLFSSDTESFEPEPETKVQVFKLTKELILPDIRAILLVRLKKFGRTRRLPQRTKRKIIARLSQKADTMRYIEHMLWRLGQLGGSEIAVLRQLNDLPSSTPELYQVMLKECQKARNDQELVVLKKLFAWLAYATEPLYLGCARMLLGYIATDNSMSIDEELENRCSRILRLSNTRDNLDDDEDYDDADDTLGEPDNEKPIENDDEDEGDVGDFFVVVGFQEKGLRSFFRPTGNPGDDDKLRTPHSPAHVAILELIQSILCTETGPHMDYRQRALYNNAVAAWSRHLQALDPADLSDEEAASVIESVYNILSNRGGSVLKMQSICRSWGFSGPPCVLGKTDGDIDKMLSCLQKWAVRATEMESSSRLSADAAAWFRPLALDPQAVFLKLAEAHVDNWLTVQGRKHDELIDNCFLFAHYALYRGRHLDAVQQDAQLRTYFMERADRGDMSEGAVSEEAFIAVSRTFPAIEMTARSHLFVAATMFYRDLEGPCLKELALAINMATTDIERMDIYTKAVEIYMKMADPKEPTLEDAKRADDNKPEDGDAGGEEVEGGDPAQKDDEERRSLEALELASRAADIALSLSDSAMEDSKIRTIVHAVWMSKARVEILRGDASNTATYCRRAIQASPKGGGEIRFRILPSLARAKSWSAFPEVFKVLCGASRLHGYTMLDEYVNEIHTAAKVTGDFDWVLEAYPAALASAVHEMEGLHMGLVVNWARFYRDVVGTPEAASQAKKFFNKAIDARVSYFVPDASFCLSDMLLEEFRNTVKLEKKMEVYNEMRDLVKRVSQSMGSEFDPSQSQTAIPLAHMAQRMDPVEYHQGLERTFKGCVAALTDQEGWNDGLSLRILARVLALVGLEREAQIAATCQNYVLDMEIFKRENEQKAAESGESSGENSRSSDGEDAADGDDGDGDLDWENTGVGCNSCKKLTVAWTKSPVYLCYYCTEIDLCQECFDKRARRFAGELTDDDDWRVLCPQGHKHIQVPVQGWEGLRNGVLRIDGGKVPFRDWLVEVKEKKWPAVWERFWGV